MSTEAGTETVGRQDRHTGSMLDVARFEGERRLPMTGVLAVVFALFGAMFVALAPDIVSTGAYDDIIEAMPPAMVALVGFENFSSIAGVISGEFYTFTWVVGLGAYLAYSAAGSVAGDLRNDRMDTLLAAPLSRTNVLLGKYLGLLVPIVVLNVVIPLVIYAGSVLVDDPIALADLAALHALSIPYLLLWAAFGLLLGVVVRRGRTAGRAALGVVLAMWLLESFVTSTDFEWLGAVSPMRYFDPAAILVNGEYGLEGAALLLGVAVVFVALSRTVFVRSDL
ncbi:ABC transporter permease subunit [Halomarina oriensis]|uniref:ABC transporter permease subunit n=1 Tax=Halomarina oriensis TaxID=671145 RepID=A0A6B0GEX5_9EURY|nr:ABC transporter permease subunit [Halomarina oriensis]MWG33496.1 ABC transporter permease subunit [Halomarina oriensis]